MFRSTASTTALIALFAIAPGVGCQRTLGTASGTAIGGPYGTAGSLPPSGSTPLVPFGPLQGATRVPPPATGSTQANLSVGAGSASAAYVTPAGDSFASPAAFAAAGHPPAGHPPAAFATAGHSPASGVSGLPEPPISPTTRSSLGGMPVNDLTAGLAYTPQPVTYANQIVGSGVAQAAVPVGPTGSWAVNPADQSYAMANQYQYPNQYQNISVPQGDLASRLRPLEPTAAIGAIPVPMQPAAQQPNYMVQPAVANVAMTQYRDDSYTPVPSWQNMPAAQAAPNWQSAPTSQATYAAPGGFDHQPPQYLSQLPTPPSLSYGSSQTPAVPHASAGMPSTEPVTTPPANLLWRNPAVAR